MKQHSLHCWNTHGEINTTKEAEGDPTYSDVPLCISYACAIYISHVLSQFQDNVVSMLC